MNNPGDWTVHYVRDGREQTVTSVTRDGALSLACGRRRAGHVVVRINGPRGELIDEDAVRHWCAKQARA